MNNILYTREITTNVLNYEIKDNCLLHHFVTIGMNV